MPAPHSPDMVRIRVSATAGGTYSNVGYVRSVDLTRGREASNTIRFFGGDAVQPGSKTLSGSMPVWWDDGDTAGQEALRTAYENDTKVWLQIAPHGTAAGQKVMQFEASIDEDPFSADSEGDAIEGTFSFTGTPSTFTRPTLV